MSSDLAIAKTVHRTSSFFRQIPLTLERCHVCSVYLILLCVWMYVCICFSDSLEGKHLCVYFLKTRACYAIHRLYSDDADRPLCPLQPRTLLGHTLQPLSSNLLCSGAAPALSRDLGVISEGSSQLRLRLSLDLGWPDVSWR